MSRAVVDTNIWISALLNPLGQPARVLQALEEGQFELVVSEPMLSEVEEVLQRPRIARKYGLRPDAGSELAGRLRRRAVLVPITRTLRLCRDPDDNLVIETAAVGQASVLVTRDDDLKADRDLVQVLQRAGIAVLSVRQFLATLG
ncbi:MAG TPA: putative toxin-antitoxin system toxin component, PIN family [Chloroflexota bacterium]|nr:putative toxin-antitoxin system toxin component, PIN family [Chloroflexota bacterium]